MALLLCPITRSVSPTPSGWPEYKRRCNRPIHSAAIHDQLQCSSNFFDRKRTLLILCTSHFRCPRLHPGGPMPRDRSGNKIKNCNQPTLAVIRDPLSIILEGTLTRTPGKDQCLEGTLTRGISRKLEIVG